MLQERPACVLHMLVVFICSSGYSPTMGSEGYQGEQLGVQISSEWSTRQCKPRRLFAPRKNPCLCRCTSTLPEAFPSRGADAPTTARGGTCSSIGLLICTGRRSKGLQGASGKPTVSINVRQLCRKETDSGGLTRRLRREQWGFRPEGGRTFFRSERKYQRKQAARRLQRRPTSLCAVGFGLREPYGLSSTSVRCAHPPGKRLLLPILTAGLAMSRAMKLDSFHKLLERARARLFPPSKWAGLFPSAAYRRSAPPQLAQGIISPCGVGCFGVACVFLQGQRPAGNQIHAGLFREP